ncbi:MAG: Bacillolysin precursor [bacterium ADurb.Bin243]|nr:MAG: Bacillolysin precursor [bacterium ADurb.Bin243]HOD39122.1 M36 family metallopeptidase [Candidatus Wallbacteria bacterium]
MKKLFFIVLILTLALVFTNAYADSANVLRFAKFNSDNGNKFSVNFDEDGNIRNIINNDANAYSAKQNKRSENELVTDAIKFLEKNSDLISGVEVRDLRVENVSASGNITHVLFSHYYKNKKVFDSQVSVHINNASEVVMLNNALSPIGKVNSVATVISHDKALEIAKKHIKCQGERIKSKAANVIYSKNKIAFETVKVELASKDPLGDFVFVINAANGEVIECFDIMFHADAPEAPKAPQGTIYMFNPMKGGIVSEPIINLTNPGKGLVGKWVTVVNEDTAPAVLNAAGNYVFDADDTHFDEVNAYYHTNKVHDFVAQYGFTGLDRSIKVTVHYGTKYDNAFFSPMEGAIALGDGNRLNDLSKEESVIYHEYGHAVTNAMVYMPYSSESGAINEAFSDYLACTMTDDSMVGEWAMAKMNKPFLRNMDNKTHYPEDIQNEVHYDSNIYGAGLWDLRKALGAEVTDKIMHFSRNYLKGIKNQKFTDGVNALIAADKEFYKGVNAETIKKVFEARGIKAKPLTASSGPVVDALKFEALNGNKEAKQMLENIENGNVK